MENEALKKRGIRNTQVGTVSSSSMQKTVAVDVDRLVQHTKYRKTVRKTSRFLAHDGEGICQVGDKVLIMETRPLSARKRWRVVEVLEKAH
jgi:small subunit ribosomal protein S17